MRGKRSRFLAVIAMTLFLAGCGGDENVRQGETAPDHSAEPDTDDQGMFLNHMAAASEEGYYFNNEYTAFYYEKDSESFVPLCGKADCRHNTMECDANLGAFSDEIYWNDGKLYLVGNEDTESREIWLYQVEPDGTNRKKLVKLFSVGDDGGLSYNLILHRGYAYYSVPLNNIVEPATNYLYRVRLESGAKPEAVDSYEGYDADFLWLFGEENAVYYKRYWINDGDIEKPETELMRYDCESGEVESVFEGESSGFVADGNRIYVDTGGEIVSIDMETGERETIYRYLEDDPAPVINFSFDGNYFYIDDYISIYAAGMDMEERDIRIVDKRGNVVQKLAIGADDVCAFGDEEYMIFYPKDMEAPIRLFDKDSIGGDEVWVELDVAKWR